MAKYTPVKDVMITIETVGNGFHISVLHGESFNMYVFESFPKLKKFLKNLIPQIVVKDEA